MIPVKFVAKRKKSMKKLFYSAIAFAAIFTVSCNKEADLLPEKAPVNDLSNLPTHIETLRAGFGDGLTRTDYEGKTFTWLQNDSIYVRVESAPDESGSVSFGFATFYAQSTGASVEFVGEVPDGYVTASPAFYVAINASLNLGKDESESFDGSYYVQIPPYTTIGADAKEGYYAADANKPLANMPLCGIKQEDGSFKFTSMTGALKLTLTDLDEKASVVQIVNPDGKLTGQFKVSEDGTLTMANGRDGSYTSQSGTEYNYSNKYSVIAFPDRTENSMTLYMPMPVGTLPAGTTLYVHDEDLNVLYERTFKKDIQIARNKVTELASLKASYDITDLGTGRYYDYVVWTLCEFDDEFVDVKITRDASTGKVFIENPYGAAFAAFEATPDSHVSGPDAVLTLNVDAEGHVNYDEHATGAFQDNWTSDSAPDGDEVAITDPYWYSTNYPQYYADFGRGNNFVAKYASDGVTPANIILSPVYSGVKTSYWFGDSFIWSNPIQIVFPGSEPVDVDMKVSYNGVESADVAAPTVSFNVELGADLAGVKIVIAEDRDAAVAAFASGTGVTTANAAGKAIVSMPANAASGTYKAFAQAQVASGLAASANYVILAAEFKYEVATDYESLGTGKFYDSVAWPYLGGETDTYVNVEIRKHTSEKKYQVVNPYGIAATQFGYSPSGTVGGPDKELVLTIDENDGVLFPDSFRTGIFMANWENDEMLITTPLYYSTNYPDYYAYMESGSNFVARYDANGVPTNILLSPVYDSKVGYWIPGYIWSNPIEIIFPGASHVDLTAEVAYASMVNEDPAQAVAQVNVVLGSDVVSAQLVIAADKASAQAALASGTGVTNVTGTGVANVNFPANAPSGKYSVFAKIQPKDGFTVAAQRLVFSEEFQYFSAADDKGYTLADIIGTYSAKTRIFTDSWGSATITMTIAESDDPFSGDIMITSFAPSFMNRYGANTPIDNVGGVYGYFDTRTGLANFADGQEFLYNANNDINWSLVNVSNEGSDIVFMLDPVGTLTCEHYIGMAAGQYGAQGIVYKPVTFTRTKTTVAPLKDPVVSKGSQRVRINAVSGLEKTESCLAKNVR